MLLKSNRLPRDYNEPEETKLYKIRKAQELLNKKISEGRVEVKRANQGDVISRGLNLNKLKTKYDPKNETGIRYLMGVFRVPIGITQEQLDILQKEKVAKWIVIMEKQGWDWIQSAPIEVTNGVYPAQNLEDGSPDLGSRERIVRTQFKKRDIQIIRTELRPEDYLPLVVGEKNNVIPKYS